MDRRLDWALPFCIGAWLLTFQPGEADDVHQRTNFQLLYNSQVRTGGTPSSRFDPDQQHQQFLTSGVLLDVRTSVLDGFGVRRRIFQGFARNTGQSTFPAAVVELLEAPVAGRGPTGEVIAGTFSVVQSRSLGDLAPGRTIGLALSLERPDVLSRLYRIRLRSAP